MGACFPSIRSDQTRASLVRKVHTVIYYIATERHLRGARAFLRCNPEMKKLIKTLTYEELLFQRGGPVGHYIFTDLDRLSRFELDCVALFSSRLTEIAPDARQLNHPAKVKDRFPLLVALHKAGINSFTATRTETDVVPPQFPVFIRSEDGCRGPETGIIEDSAAYQRALDQLRADGKTRRGRIAIGFAAQAGHDGYYRKYGAYKIGGDILPHHLHYGRHWVVKRSDVDKNSDLRNVIVNEELAYVRDNPHRDILARVFEIAEVEFGRVDYGIVDGKVAIYEINTNPKLPRFTDSDERNAIRAITKPQMFTGFQNLNTPIMTKAGFAWFRMPKPRDHRFRWPIRALPVAVFRLVLGLAITFARQRTR